jgi:hypothetical protein
MAILIFDNIERNTLAGRLAHILREHLEEEIAQLALQHDDSALSLAQLYATSSDLLFKFIDPIRTTI